MKTDMVYDIFSGKWMRFSAFWKPFTRRPSTIPVGGARMVHVPRILLVDDETAVRKFFAAALTGYGFAVTAATSGRHALSLLSDSEFEVVIFDMSLPDLDGLELIRRARLDFPFLRIVAISGFMGGVLQREATSAGADVTLSKPTTPSQLRNTVYRSLDSSVPWRGRGRQTAAGVRQTVGR